MQSAVKSKFFQFLHGKYPIFLDVEEEVFDNYLVDLLKHLHFHPCEANVLEKTVEKGKESDRPVFPRVLKIRMANARIASRITQSSLEDQYGPESIGPKTGYSLYRYKNL